jgi:hypothetical protein
VLLMELAYCRLRWDGVSRVVRPINVVLRLSSESAARVPPAGAFAWSGELASHALLRGILR